MHLEPTGERMIVDAYQSSPQEHLIYLMHMATYRYAEGFTRGKRVLDFGAGSGYGTSMIAASATKVIGVDVAEDAVAFANARYASDNLSFQQVHSGEALPFADASFDVVLSFQVFEHVEHEQQYLAEISRVLDEGGILILVTPDRSTRLFAFQQPWNRWHLREYSEAALRQQLERQFPHLQVLKMSGRREVIDIELRRCRKMMWLSAPFTLPFYPRALRVALLNLVHAARRTRKEVTVVNAPGFSEADLEIGAGLSPSLNLVAIARK